MLIEYIYIVDKITKNQISTNALDMHGMRGMLDMHYQVGIIALSGGQCSLMFTKNVLWVGLDTFRLYLH